MSIPVVTTSRKVLKSSASFGWSGFAATGIGIGLLFAFSASSASANPAIGTVTTGSASLATSASKTRIDQKSEDVVIDWSSFNIGAGQTTQFVQPNAQALAVNRIGGNSASQILGTLDANGRIVLINGNGMLFGKGSRVDVGSLVATSTGGSDLDVVSGKFTQAGNRNASVVNQGRIRTAQSGLVALVAPSVTNAGTVRAKLGTVSLGAANTFTVDFTGDGLVSFAAQGDVSGQANAVNTGKLSGANVSLTAHAAEGVATGVVNMSGTIVAQAAHQQGGTIVLDAGSGALATTGTLYAAGKAAGGRIETSGNSAAISGHITAGQGGHWIVDPDNLTVNSSAAATIHYSLQHGTNVELQTTASGASGPGIVTAGAGDIDIESQIAWSSAATLTLDAYHSINVSAPIKIEGAGTLSLATNAEATDGVLDFSGGYAAFTDVVGSATQGALSINGNAYTLENNLASLAAGIESDGSGYFALANSYNAKADGTYSQAPIQLSGNLDFAGDLEGLGNTISHLKIINTTSESSVGLFYELDGKVENLTLAQVNVLDRGINDVVGGLAGETGFASIFNISVSGTIKSSGDPGATALGGLIGDNGDSTILNSTSSANVVGKYNLGGLVGDNFGSSIINSFATGSVARHGGLGNSGVGGLVGVSAAGSTISDSYVTGAISALGLTSVGVGGLIGLNEAQLTNDYATGSVTGAANEFVGGLVGENTSSGTIADAYSSGAVSAGSGSLVGGFVGEDGSSSGITNAYWDATTSGISNTSQGAGNRADDPGITGLTTVQLQSGLPAGFSASVWGENASINGGLPYLLALPPA